MNLQEPRSKILLLAVAQALYSSCVIIVFSTGGLVGLMLAPSKGLATLPITAFVVGSMLAVVPASMFMKRWGRIPIFTAGALINMVGALLSIWAIYHNFFWLFCAGAALQGVFQATSSFYGFAAIEAADIKDKSIAISWVLTGGVVAAIVGTVIASKTADLLAPFTFAGSYVAVAVLAASSLIIFAILKLPKPTLAEISGPQRSWPELLRQPKLIVAFASAILSYALMNLMMTAAPVAMVACGFDASAPAWVIQWHVLAMFVPSFFTGQLIKRFGVELITGVGMAVLFIAGVVGLSGISFGHFSVALILLGLGWNFGFIGGTTMLTSCYEPSERAKVQAVNNFGVSLMVAIASASSGQMLSFWGWSSVALTVMPLAALMLGVIAWKSRAKLGDVISGQRR
ncbi:MAG: MFS transporter [Aestuariivirga sp.]